MSFGRTVLIATLLWVLAISLLYACLNWDVLDFRLTQGDEAEKFRVGYLPVT
jgi:hypothetical protein